MIEPPAHPGRRSSPTHEPDPAKLHMATVLLVEEGWTDQRIADYLGISRRTLGRWKWRAEVQFAVGVNRTLWRRRYSRASGHRLRQDDGPESPSPVDF